MKKSEQIYGEEKEALLAHRMHVKIAFFTSAVAMPWYREKVAEMRLS
jgi:hypothetical protein